MPENKLVIPTDILYTQNVYINAERRKNFYVASKMKKEATNATKMFIVSQMADGVSFVYPARLRFVWYMDNYRKDLDNVSSAGRKIILDGAQQAEYNGKIFLPNDSHRYLIEFNDIYELDKDHPRVEITQY